MITKGNHLGQPCYILENSDLKVAVLQGFGAKIASVVYKDKNFEFLFQPTKGEYETPEYRGDFSKYDTSGLDDTIPTIDECIYPGTDIILPDHGDVWSVKWDMIIEGDELVCRVDLKSLPLTLIKRIFLNGESMEIHYSLINKTNSPYRYLWAFHGLNNFNDSTKLEFEPCMKNIINVKDNNKYNFDYTRLKNYKDRGAYKFYFTDKPKTGIAKLIYDDVGLEYQISYDPEILPYLGVWITKGGFKGEYNVAIEPCDGFYDTLTRSIDNNRFNSIESNSVNSWNVVVTINKKE